MVIDSSALISVLLNEVNAASIAVAIESASQRLISAATKTQIDKLLLERLFLAGIVRVTGVSARWMQYYVNAKYAAVPQVADVPVQKKPVDRAGG